MPRSDCFATTGDQDKRWGNLPGREVFRLNAFSEVTLRFVERGGCEIQELHDLGRVESAEAFGNVATRPARGVGQLIAKPKIARGGTGLQEFLDVAANLEAELPANQLTK